MVPFNRAVRSSGATGNTETLAAIFTGNTLSVIRVNYELKRSFVIPWYCFNESSFFGTSLSEFSQKWSFQVFVPSCSIHWRNSRSRVWSRIWSQNFRALKVSHFGRKSRDQYFEFWAISKSDAYIVSFDDFMNHLTIPPVRYFSN